MSTDTATDSNTGPSAGWRRWRPVLGALPAVVLAIVAIWEIAVIARVGGGVPSDDEWRSAADVVRLDHQPGDLIVFAPRWVDPIGREHLGDLIPVDMAARMDGARYGRIWELSTRGARAPETRGLTPAMSINAGNLSVRLFERRPVEVVTDFVTAFKSATRTGRVAVELQEVGFEPHRCINARPGPGRTVTVAFAEVALGSELVGYVGLADVFTRRDDREPGRLEVLIDGAPAVTAIAGINDGWVRFRAATTPSGSAAVEFRASGVGETARKRLICFAAEARR